MKREKSCGAVVFTRQSGKIEYLLIQNLGGVFGFPKGHVEDGETEVETALREVYEEVGVRVQLIDGFRTEEEHPIPSKKDTVKYVVYFLGEYEGQTFQYQKEELSNALLTDYESALGLLQYESDRRILKEANEFLLAR